MNPERWLAKRFKRGRYTCWDFVVEILAAEFGLSLPDWRPERLDSTAVLRAILDGRLRFTRLEAPQDPSLALFLRESEPHIGLHWQGRVLHLLPEGARYEPLAALSARYPTTEHYLCAPA